MKLRSIFMMVLGWISIVVAGCGGGDSNATGTLSLAPPTSSVAAGKTITLTATYAHPNGVRPTGLTVDFRTDRPDIFDNQNDVPVGSDGRAIAFFTAKNTISADQTVTVNASSEGVNAPAAVITVKANKLTVTVPNQTGSLDNAAVQTAVQFTATGDFITFTDGDGTPLANTDITIEVSGLIGSIPGTNVVFWWQGVPVAISTPPATVTARTDSRGKIDPLYSVVVDAPPVGVAGTNIVNVIFKATTVATGSTPAISTTQNASYTVTRD